MNRYILSIILFVTVLLSAQAIAFSDTSSTEELSQPDSTLTSGIRLRNLSTQIDSLMKILSLKADEKHINNKLEKLDDGIRSIKNELELDVKRLTDKIRQLEANTNDELIDMNKSIIRNETNTYNLKKKVVSVSEGLSVTNMELSFTQNETGERITNIDDTISKRTIYWIIAISFILLLLSTVFFFLRTKVIKQSDTLSKEIEKTREKLENEAIQLDTKLVQILEQKLDIENLQTTQSNEPDHSLPKKVCEEIQRIRNRLKHMPQDDQATKVIRMRLDSLEEKLNEKGYEIVNLEGKPFEEEMTACVHFIPDENLEYGESKITRVINPQINFNDVLIQAAEVEVSQGV